MSGKRLLTGIKPSGSVHLGNYFGAVKPFQELQNAHDFDQTFLFIANYHALTGRPTGSDLTEMTQEIILDYLAMGINESKTVMFLQSDVPRVTELTWMLNNFMSVAHLERAHAYKDAVAHGKDPNVGLFDYPVLMAADILLYGSTHVPVGEDQKQHLEMTRDLAEEVNADCAKEIFPLPESVIPNRTGILPGTDGNKMSKSYGNTIEMFADEKTLRKQVMAIVTDSKRPEEPKNPEECNIYALHKHITPADDLAEIERGYREGGLSYKESKEQLFESLKIFLEPFRERRHDLTNNSDEVRRILQEGADIANAEAEKTMRKVRSELGILSYSDF